jgi:ketosteroid isomerase-like protein
VDVREWLDRYARAWREKDADAAAALFTEDGVYRSHPLREPHVGREGVRAYWTRATSTQEDLDLRLGEPVVEGSRAAVEWWATMRDGEEEITLPGILMLRFAADGRCEELRETWHFEPGRTGPPPGWGV